MECIIESGAYSICPGSSFDGICPTSSINSAVSLAASWILLLVALLMLAN